MELKKLVLKNFRSHRKFSLTFNSGITAIVGENGTGKSSIVEAIIFLFTGEGYGFKADMLSLGEASGYVIGHILVDGKEAILERHLDTSKVSLKYDDVVYKKSSEVSELWEKLFQIDKNIFKNIIVAQQGDIPLLFSGDNSIKEKIFQKIFMVPNTTKIREAVWNKYIKVAPPEYPVVPDVELSTKAEGLESELAKAKEELEALPGDLESSRLQALSRLNFIAKCLNAANDRKDLERDIESLQTRTAENKKNLANLNKKLSNINISETVDLFNALKANKPHYEKSLTIKNRLVGLQASFVPFPEASQLRLTNIEKTLQEEKVKLDIYRTEAENIEKQLTDYHTKGLVGETVCPACGAALENIAQYLAHLEMQLSKSTESVKAINERATPLEAEFVRLSAYKEQAERYTSEIKETETALQTIGAVEFDQASYELFGAVIVQYQKLVGEKETLEKLESAATQEHLRYVMKLAALPEYDNAKPNMMDEKAQLDEAMQVYQQQSDKRLALLQSVAGTTKALEFALQAYENNKEAKNKNAKRNAYVGVLHEIYELLNTSQFPRKLIQTYAETVSSYLCSNLQKFSFPYEAKVNANFGIDVYDDKDRLLPSVSGGQEIMIGIALRLALHNMFGAAFPMMILDEGSVHLSHESKKSYFNIVRKLKTSDSLKQIILIDHDEELASVVDHTIKLE